MNLRQMSFIFALLKKKTPFITTLSMVAITSAFIALTDEIVTVLCGVTISFNTLLARLQTQYPASNWTEPLLTSTLNAIIKLGTVSPVGGYAGGPVTGYTINKYGLNINNAFNKNFNCFIFLGAPCCPVRGQYALNATNY